MDAYLHELDRGRAPKRARETDDGTGDLFAAAAVATPPKPEHHASRAADSVLGNKLLTLLTPIAVELLDREQAAGVTVAEVRLEADRRGLLANDGKESLDALGALFRRIPGAVASGRTRRAPAGLEVSHGNRHTVWVWRKFA